jgi:hypothetical protein
LYLNKEKTTSIFSSPTSDLPNYESQPRTIENQTTSSTSYSSNTNNPSLIPENSINQIKPNINQNIQNISIQEIYEPLVKACLFKTVRICYAQNSLLNSEQNMLPTNVIGWNYEKDYEKYDNFEEKIKFESKYSGEDKIKSGDLSLGLNYNGVDFGAGMGGHKNSNKSENKSSDSYDSNQDSTVIDILVINRFQITMPPEKLNLSENALKKCLNITDLKSANEFLTEYGSHCLKAEYKLGGLYFEYKKKTNEQTKNDSSNSDLVGNSHGGHGGLNGGKLIKTTVKIDNAIAENSSNTEKNSKSVLKSENRARAIGPPTNDKEHFVEEIYNSTKYLRITNMNDINEKLENIFNSSEELDSKFRETFMPMWQILQRNSNLINTQIIEKIKLMCILTEKVFFFNVDVAKFLLKKEILLIRNYLDNLNKSIFEIMLENDRKNLDENNFTENLIQILNDCKHDTIDFHFKLKEYSIEFILKNQYLDYKYGNNHFYLLCYNEKLKSLNKEQWKNLLDKFLNCNKFSKINNIKCAIINYDDNDLIINDDFPKILCVREYKNKVVIKYFFENILEEVIKSHEEVNQKYIKLSEECKRYNKSTKIQLF